MSNDNIDVLYVVVSNDEGQYSIWPDGKVIPAGWIASTMCASKAACLHFISQTWTDMRPASLRTQIGPRQSDTSLHR
jgi:MbtH protein